MHLVLTTRRFHRLAASVGVAVVAAAAVVVLTAQAANAAAPVPIRNYNSGLCLQPVPVNGGSIYDNGVPIWQVPCNGSEEQNWKKLLLPDTNSRGCKWWQFLLPGRCGFDPTFYEYYIVNQKTLSCMDVTDARADNHTPIQQWQCNNGGSEKWWLPPSDGDVGTFVDFMNFRTGKCLDVPAGTLQPSPMQQYTCTTTTTNGAQMFEVPPS
jgi:hypothetical protein